MSSIEGGGELPPMGAPPPVQAKTNDEIFAEQRAKEKKKKKRHARKGEEPPREVSINSLLDVLSVILMFLMKSYTSSSVQVKPSKELQLPFTKSTEIVKESVAVTITLRNVLVNDEPVMVISEGKVPPDQLAEEGLMIQPLFNKLKDEVDHLKKIASRNPKAKFDGQMTIISDRFVPFSLLTQVMYTAGQSEFSKFDFIAIKLEGG
jgi:biopolymer transport protein ExbD